MKIAVPQLVADPECLFLEYETAEMGSAFKPIVTQLLGSWLSPWEGR